MAKVEARPEHKHILNDALLQGLTDQLPRLATAILSEKFATQGVRLSPRHRKTLHACVVSQDFSRFTLPARTPRGLKKIKIAWTAKNSHRLEREAARLLKRLPDVVKAESELLAKRIHRKLKSQWQAQSAGEERVLSAFRTRLCRRWRQPLEGLSMMLTITREFSELVGAPLQEARTKENRHLIAVLTRLHARACQVAHEILTLLKDGFADGAMARWRTLHEIAVVAMFVRDRGDAMAERYLLHDRVESYKAMLLYQKHARRLGLKRMPARKMRIVTASFNAMIAKFGKPFGSEFGWASETPTERPNFSEIEAKITVDHWRPYYKLASHNVHANPKGILFKMGLAPERDLLLTGPSNYGLADPGQNTALTLNQVSAALGSVAPTLDTNVFLKVLLTLSREVGDAFVLTQHRLERMR